ncbi:MAG: hypothetical protein AAF962_22555 [Actinomycetota bacterium]
MAIRDKIQTNAQPHLQPGEQVQAVWAGQTHSQWLLLVLILVFLPLVIWFLFANRYRTVVATDRRILVLDSGHWTMTKANSVVAELPRQTPVGPASGLWFKSQTLGSSMYVHKRFHKDIAEADAAAGLSAPVGGAPLAPPPAA